ncbi:hypothetical protein ROHU_006481 [Labeo rohita]|uniref:Uncharacterized protein n=1 Tax=Labeo rohita TaxID=84645 RepID=A0A498MUI2_LABRO|nr:hypothetical protein ROHU_006481 [Labeo rohita]
MEGNSVLCCSGKDWYWDTGRKRRCHGTPSRNRRRNVASESRFGNTVKRGLWELEVEVEQTTLKYCTRTQVTYTLQLNTVVTLPERLLHLVLYTHTSFCSICPKATLCQGYRNASFPIEKHGLSEHVGYRLEMMHMAVWALLHAKESRPLSQSTEGRRTTIQLITRAENLL